MILGPAGQGGTRNHQIGAPPAALDRELYRQTVRAVARQCTRDDDRRVVERRRGFADDPALGGLAR